MRSRSREQRATNIELFFDLVYVFAITQLSHFLLAHSTVRGALQAGLLLAMVWTVWVYTTWVTNWLDPEKMAVRLLLVVLMLASLAMSISLPRGFGDLGLWVGGAYAVQQIGRSVFMVIALRGHPLQANFERILAWCVASSAFAVGGGFAHGPRPGRLRGRPGHGRRRHRPPALAAAPRRTGHAASVRYRYLSSGLTGSWVRGKDEGRDEPGCGG